MMPQDRQELLQRARAKALALIAALERDRSSLQTTPRGSKLSPNVLTEGRQAVDAAIDAARGTLDNLDRALLNHRGCDRD